MQREDVLGKTLQLLELKGIAAATPEMVVEQINYPMDEFLRFWPDKEALVYDALRFLSQQIDTWRRQLEVDDPAMVAKQMELVLEGCLSRMLINRSQTDVDTAHRLAEDILRFAQCRQGGALT